MKRILCLSLFFLVIELVGQDKNILFIVIDDLKPEIGAYGFDHAKTPNLDALACMGTIFTKAYAQYARCGPSRASFLTGMRPDATEVWKNAQAVRKLKWETFPDFFRENGYITSGIGKIHHEKDEKLTKWGFPYVVSEQLKFNSDHKPPVMNLFQSKEVREAAKSIKRNGGKVGYQEMKRHLLDEGVYPVYEMLDIPDDAYRDGAVSRQATELIDTLVSYQEPFFLAVGFRKPHLPFNAPKKYWDLYQRDELPVAEFQGKLKGLHKEALHNSDELARYSGVPPLDLKTPLDIEKQKELIHAYLACVSFVDAQVGQLIDHLAKSNILDNTIVVVVGDHGWHLGDHRMWGKGTNFEQATRIPMIIYDSSLESGQTVDEPVEMIDIFPTLCGLTGLPKSKHLQGDDLTEILCQEEDAENGYAMSQTSRGKVMGYTIRSNRYRYTEWHHHKLIKQGEYRTGNLESVELYDYELDPLEKRNLAEDPNYAQLAKLLKYHLILTIEGRTDEL